MQQKPTLRKLTGKTKKAQFAKPIKKALTHFRIKVKSRHPTHDPLRNQLPLMRFRSVVRLGSTTNYTDGKERVECNTIEAVSNSANKLRMKRCFDQAEVKSAKWCQGTTVDEILTRLGANDFKSCHGGIVSKSLTGSRGRGNQLHTTQEGLIAFLNSHANNLNNYIFERYYDYVREYRLHVTKHGCFYTNRKMLKEGTPENQRWYRNDSNCVWIKEDNEQFDRPSNWNNIVSECVKALKAVGLDVGACDVKVQGSKDKNGKVRPTPDFIVIEINSAPSFGEITTQKYLAEIPKILTAKRAGI